MCRLHLRSATIILLTIFVFYVSSQQDDDLVDDAEIPKPPALKPEEKVESKIHDVHEKTKKDEKFEESPQLSKISDNGHKKKAEASQIKTGVHDGAEENRNSSKDKEQNKTVESVKEAKLGDKTEDELEKKLEHKGNVDRKDNGDVAVEQSLEKTKDKEKKVDAETRSKPIKDKVKEKFIENVSEESEGEKLEADARKKFTQRKKYEHGAPNKYSTFGDGTLLVIVIIVLVLIYGLIHNRKKILGLIVEGKSGRRSTSGRRMAGNVRYRKLDTDDVEQRNYIS